MKTSGVLLFFILAPLGAEQIEIKGSNGTMLKLDVQAITHEFLVITKGGSAEKQNVPLSKVDMKWMEEKQPDLFKKYKDAVADYESLKSFDPLPVSQKMVKALTDCMKSDKQHSSTWVYQRDEQGRITSVTHIYDNDFLKLGGMYDYITKAASTQPSKAERSLINSKLQSTSDYCLKLRNKLLELPNAKESIECQKIHNKLTNLAESLEKLKAERSAFDRTAATKAKECLDFLVGVAAKAE